MMWANIIFGRNFRFDVPISWRLCAVYPYQKNLYIFLNLIVKVVVEASVCDGLKVIMRLRRVSSYQYNMLSNYFEVGILINLG